jgi:hypothetical protein
MGHATGNQFIVQNKWLRHMCRPIHSGLRQSLSYCRQAFDVQSTARVLFSGAEADNAIFWCLFISTAIVIVVIATVVVTVLFCWPSVVTNERGCHLRSLSSVDCRIMKYQFVALVEWYWQGKPQYSDRHLSHCHFVHNRVPLWRVMLLITLLCIPPILHTQ